MLNGMSKRVVIYARLSVKSDTSVSIARQSEAARKYADAQGWDVIADAFVDEGVSATLKRPEDRQGWRNLLALSEQYDAALVWKIDRLSRRALDFLHADAALQERGAGIVSVTEPIDMTTVQGRAFATMLAVFAEMEAEQIRTRVKGARDYLIRSGRVVGGTVPYGWRSLPNPAGKGLVLAHDPERIPYVRGMAERALRGATLYSIVQWLGQVGAPLPTASQTGRKHENRWSYATVERLLRNPVLAGMTPYQPGRGRHGKTDPTAVLRDDQGLPIIADGVAILSAEERRRLLHRLDTRETPQSRPRSTMGCTSVMLSGLTTCGHCDRTMHRGTTQGRPSLSCPDCHQTISRLQLDPYIVRRLLSERGALSVWEHTQVPQGTSTSLADIEQAIRDVTSGMGRDEADLPALLSQLEGLKELRATARRDPALRRIWWITERTVREEWEAAQDDEQRRRVLADQVASIRIVRGKVGRSLDPGRVSIEWQPMPAGLVLPDGRTWPSDLKAVESVAGLHGVIGSILVRAGRHIIYTG